MTIKNQTSHYLLEWWQFAMLGISQRSSSELNIFSLHCLRPCALGIINLWTIEMLKGLVDQEISEINLNAENLKK